MRSKRLTKGCCFEMAGLIKPSSFFQCASLFAVVILALILLTSIRNKTSQCDFRIEQPSSRKPNLWTDLMAYPQFKFDPNFKNPCWYEGEELKCLPYMYIFGVKKCGTSDFMKRLGKHPDFVDPGFREAQWFARKRFENRTSDDINFYVNMFKDAANRIKEESVKRSDGTLINEKLITGEKSPSNLHINSNWKELPGNENLNEPRYVNIDFIHHFLPNIKILIIFRNPVDRLYSDYHHEYGTLMPGHTPTNEEFHSVVENGINLYKKCFQRRSVRSCVYDSSIYDETKIQIQLGIYYVYWQDILRLYPREQIFILRTELLRHQSNEYLNSVYKFLEISTLSDEEMKNYGIALSKERPASRWGSMLEKTADLLYDFYEPFNKVMVDLTGDKDFLYERT